MIDIVLPSKNRELKLTKTLDSIDTSIIKNVNVYVYFDTQEEIDNFSYKRNWLSYRIIKNYSAPNLWNSHIKNMTADVLIFANDDIAIYKDTLLKIKEVFINKSPDFDGIIGLNQVNIDSPTKLDSAFCAIGTKFADRFPDRQIYCPDYHRFFGDKELGLFAKSINKFHYDESIRILHFHPGFGGIKDSTHIEVRKFLQKDEYTFFERQKKGYLWGQNFNLINI